jgi:3-deoxy-7-phosphoheptulonate synthase
MSHPRLENLNIESVLPLPTPHEMKVAIPLTAAVTATVARGRETIEHILDGDDARLFVVVGPCSIHNLDAAEEYARKLKALADEVASSIYVVMRVYFEKPRSSIGWKGLINDPYMNDTFHIEEGIRMARHFLFRVAELGLPAATELLDVLMPQYIGDLISWNVIGARTAEAQTHREIASGISTPIGFKNTTDGALDAAINGIRSAMGPHHFLGVTEDGLPAVFSTTGNAYPHIVLRGGKTPNYNADSIAACEKGPPRRPPAPEHHGRLLPRQLRQESRTPGRRVPGCPFPDRSRQPLHPRRHARKQPRSRQPAHAGQPRPPQPPRLHHRRLHRLAHHRSPAARSACPPDHAKSSTRQDNRIYRMNRISNHHLSAVRRTWMPRISFGFGRGCFAEITGRFSDGDAPRTTRAGLVSASGRPRSVHAEKMPVGFRAVQIQKKSSLANPQHPHPS